MFGLIAVAVTLVASWVGYGTARRFVRQRLRYVDSVQKPFGAIVAGFAAFLVAGAVISLLTLIPLLHYIVGGGTALIFGASVGLGVRSGAQDVKRGYVLGPGA